MLVHVDWEPTAWEYHGDDGLFFHAAYDAAKWDCGKTYTRGDTIGCGLDKKGTLFFTKNGQKIVGKTRRFRLMHVERFSQKLT